MNARVFDRLVQAAIARLPEPFRGALREVPVLVEDWPEPELVQAVTGDPEETLYGLFDGVPLPERSLEDPPELPAVIRLYRGPLAEDFPLRRELAEQIELTLVHEIAHLMGLDEQTIRAYGYE